MGQVNLLAVECLLSGEPSARNEVRNGRKPSVRLLYTGVRRYATVRIRSAMARQLPAAFPCPSASLQSSRTGGSGTGGQGAEFLKIQVMLELLKRLLVDLAPVPHHAPLRLRLMPSTSQGRNDDSERMTTPAPHMRIVSDELWDAVAKRERNRLPQTAWSTALRHMFSGLIKCHCCGSSYVVSGSDGPRGPRIACTGRRERGDCTNRRSFSPRKIENRLASP